MRSRLVAATYRTVFAALAAGAVAFQLFAIHIPLGYSVGNYFVYFTNLSNIIVAAVFIISAIRLFKTPKPSQADTAIRGAAVVYDPRSGRGLHRVCRHRLQYVARGRRSVRHPSPGVR